MAGPLGLIPEQVWDGPAIPAVDLYPGRPTGSAMPLAWAHAEFVKLAYSRHLGRPVDQPSAVWQRYGGRHRKFSHAFWWPHAPIGTLPQHCRLHVCTSRAAHVRWGHDGWQDVAGIDTEATGLGVYAAELRVEHLLPGQCVDFTLQWQDTGAWEGRDFRILVATQGEVRVAAAAIHPRPADRKAGHRLRPPATHTPRR